MSAFLIPAIGTLASAAAFPLVSRMLEGSPEEQMRRQYKVQRELEAEDMAGGAAGLDGLVGGQQAMSLSDMMAEADLLRDVTESAYKLKKAREERPRYLDELNDILEGQTARVAALQSERVLSPLEIIQMMEGFGG